VGCRCGVVASGRKSVARVCPPPVAALEPPPSQTALLLLYLSPVNFPRLPSLYVEKIDVGEAEPRQVVSGLRQFISVEDFTNKLVLVMINLRPSKFRGVMSSGMVMCASSASKDKLEVLSPPEGVPVGERVNIEGEDGEPDKLMPKKKSPWEQCAAKFLVDAKGVCGYDGKPLFTSKGPITCAEELAGGHVG
jgi:aminoacyl tRNA synthase complex-interacting multifunctional protein 1